MRSKTEAKKKKMSDNIKWLKKTSKGASPDQHVLYGVLLLFESAFSRVIGLQKKNKHGHRFILLPIWTIARNKKEKLRRDRCPRRVKISTRFKRKKKKIFFSNV
jgi:hypothetical protein